MKKHSDIYFDYITAAPCPLKIRERLLTVVDSYWAADDKKYADYLERLNRSIYEKLGTYVALSSSYQEILPSTYQNVLVSAHVNRPTFEILQKQKVHILPLPIGPRGYIERETIEAKGILESSLLLLPSVDLCSGVLQPLDVPNTIDLLLDVTHTFGKVPLSSDNMLIDCTKLGSPIPLYARTSKEPQSYPLLFAALFEALLEESREASFVYSTEVTRIRNLFETMLKESCPGVWVLHQEEERIPNLSTIIFPDAKNEALLFLLSKRSVAASMGGDKVQTLSAQLFEEGYAPHIAQGALSFSFAPSTTEEEIAEGISRIKEAYEQLQKIGLSHE